MEKIKLEDIELIWRTKGTTNESLKILAEKINETIEWSGKFENLDSE